MVFSDLLFLYIFLPLFFIFYFNYNKNIVLCVFSFIFYAFGEPIFVLILLINVFINYVIGILIEDNNNASKKAFFLILGICLDLLLLLIFKYINLISFLLFFNVNKNLITHIRLPIGISFFTFQSISYIVDVYRQTVKCERKYSDLFLYIAMFPQLIAGPIVRYNTISYELKSRTITIDDILYGIYRFVFGLGKKVIIANQLSVIVEKFLNVDLIAMSKLGLIFGVILFIIQLYFDFSGYSDMAIGLGYILGFHFEENFDYPFISNSMTEFWRRWHISLGTFFRDYLYIPLGGNKHNQIRNIFIVWFLTGVWHGATLNFVIWGIFLAIVIILEKKIILKFLKKLPLMFCKIYFLIIVYISFSIFYFDDVSRLKAYYVAIIMNKEIIDLYTKNLLLNNIFLIAVSIFFILPVSEIVNDILGLLSKNRVLETAIRCMIIILILIYSTILLIGNTANPFLYFRF